MARKVVEPALSAGYHGPKSEFSNSTTEETQKVILNNYSACVIFSHLNHLESTHCCLI